MSEAQCKNSAHKAFLDKHRPRAATVPSTVRQPELLHIKNKPGLTEHTEERTDRKYGHKILVISYHLRTSNNGNNYEHGAHT